MDYWFRVTSKLFWEPFSHKSLKICLNICWYMLSLSKFLRTFYFILPQLFLLDFVKFMFLCSSVFVYCLILSWSFSTGSSLSHKVHQSPADIYKKPGERAKIRSSHSIDNYDRIFWYKQINNRQLQLLGYMFVDTEFPETRSGVKMEGNRE